MVTNAARPTKLTPKGQRTRARIVDAAAVLMHARGLAGTTLEDVKAAAGVSGSQLYHYFVDKEDLVQAVVDLQADHIVGNQKQADLGNPEGLQRWRTMVLRQAGLTEGQGGCPLGSLGTQLAETDLQARSHVATGFARWSEAITEGLRELSTAGHLSPDVDPDDLAVTLLAILQGGLLLAQVHRDTRVLATAIDTLLALATEP